MSAFIQRRTHEDWWKLSAFHMEQGIHFAAEVDTFIIFWCDASLGSRVPKITKIGLFFTEIFKEIEVSWLFWNMVYRPIRIGLCMVRSFVVRWVGISKDHTDTHVINITCSFCTDQYVVSGRCCCISGGTAVPLRAGRTKSLYYCSWCYYYFRFLAQHIAYLVALMLRAWRPSVCL